MLHDLLETNPALYAIAALSFFAWVTGYCIWNDWQRRRIEQDKARRRENGPRIWE